MSVTVTITTNPINDNLKFLGQNITLSAISAGSIQAGEYLYYQFYQTGYTSSGTSASTITRVANIYGTINCGVRYFVKNISDVIVSAGEDVIKLSTSIQVNRLPNIVFVGIPNINSQLTFNDDTIYLPNTIVSADWNFGDGQTSSTTNTMTSFEHSYTTLGVKIVSVSAYDISGNVGISNSNIGIVGGENFSSQEDYITICGPDILGRFGDNKEINLVEYLPNYLRDSETEQFLILFQDFLNNIYDGVGGWQTSTESLPVTFAVNSATNPDEISSTYQLNSSAMFTKADDVEQITYSSPNNINLATSAQKISMLEKINRLTEFHDPDLIDIDYIQFFAGNLGYSINVSRDDIVTNDNFGLTEFGGDCSAADINKYLRFVVSNLPSWYKIKTTRSSVKVMLYSFGLIGDIIEYFTNNYLPTTSGGDWKADYSGDLLQIPDNYFPTPHFSIYLYHDQSSDISFDIGRNSKVVRAIESIRPINTVFDNIVGYVKRIMNMSVAGFIQSTRYQEIKSNGYSNGIGNWNS